MPEYAAYLLNRLHKGHDGMVAYERVKGKIPSVLGAEPGEKMRYRNRVSTKAENRVSWKSSIPGGALG